MIGPKGILKGAIALHSNVMTDTGKHFAEMRGGVLSAISLLSVLWIERPFSREKGLSKQPQPRRGAGSRLRPAESFPKFALKRFFSKKKTSVRIRRPLPAGSGIPALRRVRNSYFIVPCFFSKSSIASSSKRDLVILLVCANSLNSGTNSLRNEEVNRVRFFRYGSGIKILLLQYYTI